MSDELMLAITAHGYGHLAQLAPVVAELRKQAPNLVIRVRSTLPPDLLRHRLGEPLCIEPHADDFGMAMHSPFAADVPTSLARYRDFHADWEERVERVTCQLAAAPPRLILADVPYLTLAAAARVGIPTLALCSLNWADILRGYVDEAVPEWASILQQIDSAYASARYFLQPAPSMPMPRLTNRLAVGPCAEPGLSRRSELRRRLAMVEGESVVLVAMGGFSHRPSVEAWPEALLDLPVRWLVPDDWALEGRNFVPFEEAGMPFSDLLASSDLLLTKPSYGSFTEAAANGIPVLFVDRGDWPEKAALVDWLACHGRGEQLTQTQLEQGDFIVPLQRQLAGGRHPPVAVDGAREVAALVLRMLSTTAC